MIDNTNISEVKIFICKIIESMSKNSIISFKVERTDKYLNIVHLMTKSLNQSSEEYLIS